ncbi:MAG: lyase family protein [Spirochaetota bacterium]
METRPVFRNLSPLDHRYYDANAEAFSELADHLSEEAMVRYCTRVEAAILHRHLEERGLLNAESERAVRELEDRVKPDDVYEEERRTHHNIRALVRVIKHNLPDEAASLVHVGATSVDILDTANALRCRDAALRVIVPRLVRLERQLIQLADDHAETLQVGRTHGQHGVPITFGFAVAEYVSRLGKSIEEIAVRAQQLRGKIAGAVGAYNSLSMVTADPKRFEYKTLGSLGLLPSDHSTQMVEPEYLLRLLLELNVAFGVVANLADDLRNLQRTEIDELRELFTSGQVGSSTMPQKRNPWNSEHVKSLWKAFAPRVTTFFMDQISEHQRDLTNSASGRFIVDYFAGFLAAIERMNKVVETLHINKERMRANLAMTGDMVLSEAAYTLLATTGQADAHEDLRTATLRAQETGEPVAAVLRANETLWKRLGEALSLVGLDPQTFFDDPTHYTGKAADEARRLAIEFTERMNKTMEVITR